MWQSNHPWNTSKEYKKNNHSQNPQPFYRTHHPWSRPRHPPQLAWSRYNPYPNNMYNPQHPMQPYYRNHAPMQPMNMQNVGFPQTSWAPPQYPIPQWNPVPPQEFHHGTLMPSISLPPPPPPPMSPKGENKDL